jgi:hypothetical protein
LNSVKARLKGIFSIIQNLNPVKTDYVYNLELPEFLLVLS